MRPIYAFLTSTTFIHAVWFLWLAGMPFSKAVSSSALGTLFGLSVLRGLVEGKVIFQQLCRAVKPEYYKPILVFCLLWVAYLLGMLYTNNWRAGGLFLWKQIPLLLTPCVLVFYYRHLQQKLRIYLWAFIVANLVAGGITLLFYTFSDNTVANIAHFVGLMPFEKGHDRAYFGLYSPFIERIQFANLLALALLSAIWLQCSSIARLERLLAVGCALGIFFCMLVLGGRGSLIGILGSVGIWGMRQLLDYYNKTYKVHFSTKIGRLFIPIMAVLLLWGVLVGVPYLAIKHVEPVKKRYEQLLWELETYSDGTFKQYNYVEFTSLRRWLSWKSHALLIQKHPILGVGTGDYRPELQKYYDQNGLGFPANAHHQLLQIWATIGLWGLLLFVAILFFWYKSIQQQCNRCKQHWALSFWVFYLLLFMTDSALSSQLGLTAFVLFAGFIEVKKSDLFLVNE